MNKRLLVLIMSILLIASVSAYVTHVYPNEVGRDDRFVVTLYNPTRESVRNAQVSIYVPGLGIYETSRSLKLRHEDSARVYFDSGFEDVQPGYYPVVVTFQNDEGVRQRTHSWVYIN